MTRSVIGVKRHHQWHFPGICLILFMGWIASSVWAGDGYFRTDTVALVNGSGISRKDYEREMNQVQNRMLRQGRQVSESQLTEIKKVVLDNIIGRELLYRESQKQGFLVKTRDAEARWSSMKDSYPSEAEFRDALNELNFTEDALRLQIERSIALQQYIDGTIAPAVSVAEKETRGFYNRNPDYFKRPETVHARHILIKVHRDDDASQRAAARKKIETIQQKLFSGEDFAALARTFSEGPTGIKGGDLGFFGRGQMVKPFEDAAFALNPGEVSERVRSDFGYHLINVIDKKPESVYSYEDVKDTIYQNLHRKRVDKEVKHTVEKLKARADVKTFLQ
ncbi:MAG: peptidylprolyl isomerase [Desulfobacterales bacterium]